VCAVAVAGALWLTRMALIERRPNLQELAFAATMVPAGEAVSLLVSNLPGWRAMIVGWGVVAAAAGAGLILASAWRPRRTPASVFAVALPIGGTLLLATGLLAQREGAVLFFAATGAAVFLRMFIPGVIRWWRDRRDENAESLAEPGTGTAGAVSLLALIGLVALIVHLRQRKTEVVVPDSMALMAPESCCELIPSARARS